MALLLGLGAPAASAAPEAGPGWAYKGSFGGPFQTYEAPRSPVAVDSGGNIFAADQNGVTFVYAPTPDGGTEFATLSSFTPRNLAVDPNTGAVYGDELVEFIGGTTIRRYLSDGQPTPTYTFDPTFEVPQADGIAVDPTTGDLLVADSGAEGVHRYDSSGTLLETIATPTINPAWIVTAPDGSFYVAPSEGPDVTHFSGTGTQLGTISGVGSLHGLAYDASRSAVVVAVGDQLHAYSPAGALLARSLAQGGGGSGLAASASGFLYEYTGGGLNLYVPGTVPGVEAPQVSAIDVYSANVSAEVDPGSGPPENSVAHFEYSADGGLTWPDEFKTPDVAVKRTVTDEPDSIEADLTGLEADSDYLVRVVAANGEPISSTSDSTAFHTLLGPPEVEAGPAISITSNSAELTGTIDTLGDQTTYHFEYGLTDSYGSKAPAGAEAVAGNERGARTFTRGISGLQPDTTYHYRLIAKNSAGEASGADRTFTTSGSGVVRAYEQVSPRNKMGGSVNPQLGFRAAADGSAFVFQAGQPPSNAPSSVLWTRWLSRRSATGWLDWQPLDPPMKSLSSTVNATTHAVSSDFTHSLVVSNRVLTPSGSNGPYEDGGNIYIQNLETGEYTYVGGGPQPGVFGAFELLSGIGTEYMYMAGAPDFSWIVINSYPPLLPGAPLHSVYKWSRDGGLKLESRLPDGSIPIGSASVPNQYEPEIYRQASDDGSVVHFSLEDGEGGVYRRVDGETTPISVSTIPGDPDTVQGGRFHGGSADGRYAFFTSMSRLSSDAPSTANGAAYFYRYDAQNDTLDFIDLTLPFFADGQDVFGIGDDGQTVYYEPNFIFSEGSWVWHEGVKELLTQTPLNRESREKFISPSGRFFAYRDGDDSLHLYDAVTKSDECISCGVGNDKGGLGERVRVFGNQPVRVVNNEGEVYFNTSNPLLAEDHNATSDVYQYHDGQLALISPGDGPYNARFAEATPDGSDVFFVTDEGIAPGDVDRGVDVYDARVGGGFPESVGAPKCEGEACKAPIARPPDLETPMSGDDGAARFAISNLRRLSSADRRKLAKGGVARLRLSVSRPGTVTVSGKKIDGSSVKAKKAGVVGVPFSLSKAALAELRDKGKLPIKLSVHFGDANPKVVRFTLNVVASKKGGRS